MKKIIIFDFDGTLVDSSFIMVDAFNKFADVFKYKKIFREDISRLRNQSSRKTLKELGITFLKLPIIMIFVHKELTKKIGDCDISEELVFTLKKLQREYDLYILTSNSKKNVKKFIENNKIEFFKDVFISTMFGKSSILKKLREKGDCYYICDETRDLVAAKQAGVKSIAVTWGFQTEKPLKMLEPNFIVSSPFDILQLDL